MRSSRNPQAPDRGCSIDVLAFKGFSRHAQKGGNTLRILFGEINETRAVATFNAAALAFKSQWFVLYRLRAASIASTTGWASGFTAGSKRAITLPSRSTRNLVKFHLISPPVVGLSSLLVRNL